MRNNDLAGKMVLFSFIASFIYWAYLFSTSHIIISCDAVAYEQLGRMLQEKGLIEYFRTGPQREPFYPLLVSVAMRLGGLLSVPYQPVMIVIQLMTLFLTQLMTLHILRLLKIKEAIISLTILYLGISPAMINSALSLFSEIATYPLILAVIIVNYHAWHSFNRPGIHAVILGITSGAIFCFLALSKAIFEIIAPGFIILLLLSYLLIRRQKYISRALIYFLTAFIVFYGSVAGYKLANKTFNNNFVITSRGDLKLFGTAVRRTEPMTTERLLTALASIPGEGFCQSIFGKEKCSYWNFDEIDSIGYKKLGEFSSNPLEYEDTSKSVIRLAIKRILQNPAQYVLFWLIEGSKMLFWESTQSGFVSHSAALEKLFNCKLFKNGLRFFVSIVTFAALFYTMGYFWKRRKIILTAERLGEERPEIVLLLCMILISLFVGIYSIFNTVVRYILPIVPIYLIIIAFYLQQLFPGNRTR